ncbi:uncharacterized protein [Malus domestica]|uniref:uncharacterized protein n=1 Tax=Malus domestica TaxID=3750 RepID=UPI0010AAEFCE|nr:uncharacterized protein LOC103420248 [Malus domestica]
MGGVLCRAAEVGNETGAVLVITEVSMFEKHEKDGKLICRLRSGESIYIKGRQFINRTSGSRIQRSIHVTALISGDETAPNILPPKCILAANDFAKYGKVTFRIVDKKLKCYPVVIPDLRRLRLVSRVGTTFVSR